MFPESQGALSMIMKQTSHVQYKGGQYMGQRLAVHTEQSGIQNFGLPQYNLRYCSILKVLYSYNMHNVVD